MENRKRMVALVLTALGALGTAGGITAARAQTVQPPATTQVSTPPAGAAQLSDADNVQQGDQNAPDSGTEATEAGEKSDGTEATEAGEKSGKEEPGDQNLPGGGHADPEGQDAQHEFQGAE